MTGVMLKEQYISYLPLLQTLNNISVIMLLHPFNIISLIPSMCKGNYVIIGTCARKQGIKSVGKNEAQYSLGQIIPERQSFEN